MKSVEAQSACMYEIVAEITAPGCSGDNAPIYAAAINDHGVVVGHYIGCGFLELPFMWSEKTGFVAIPLPEGFVRAEPMDINNNGEIVGFMSPFGPDQPFHWKDGVWTQLPLLPVYPIARANAINDEGLVVGEAFDPNAIVEPFRAVMWENGTITALQLPLGPNAYALDINEQSFAAGLMGDGLFGIASGFLHEQNTQVTIEIPPVLGSDSSEAVAVNNHNVATGQSIIPVKTGSYPRRSWIFENGELTNLGVLPDADHRTIANDINDASQIIGLSKSTENGSDTPFLWQHGEILNLESLVTETSGGIFLGAAYAINNDGLVVADDLTAAQLYVLAPLNRPLGDVNIDCVVDERDLIDVLADWGDNKVNHPTDMVTSATFQPPGDGRVDGADLAVVLGNWSLSGSGSQPKRK